MHEIIIEIRQSLEAGDVCSQQLNHLAALSLYAATVLYMDSISSSVPPMLRYQTLHNCGSTLAQLGQCQEALPFYLSALQLNPYDHKLLRTTSTLLMEQYEDYPLSLEMLTLCLEQRPSNYSYICGAATCLLEMKKFNECDAILQRAFALTSTDPTLSTDSLAWTLKQKCRREREKPSFLLGGGGGGGAGDGMRAGFTIRQMFSSSWSSSPATSLEDRDDDEGKGSPSSFVRWIGEARQAVAAAGGSDYDIWSDYRCDANALLKATSDIESPSASLSLAYPSTKAAKAVRHTHSAATYGTHATIPLPPGASQLGDDVASTISTAMCEEEVAVGVGREAVGGAGLVMSVEQLLEVQWQEEQRQEERPGGIRLRNSQLIEDVETTCRNAAALTGPGQHPFLTPSLLPPALPPALPILLPLAVTSSRSPSPSTCFSPTFRARPYLLARPFITSPTRASRAPHPRPPPALPCTLPSSRSSSPSTTRTSRASPHQQQHSRAQWTHLHEQKKQHHHHHHQQQQQQHHNQQQLQHQHQRNQQQQIPQHQRNHQSQELSQRQQENLHPLSTGPEDSHPQCLHRQRDAIFSERNPTLKRAPVGGLTGGIGLTGLGASGLTGGSVLKSPWALRSQCEGVQRGTGDCVGEEASGAGPEVGTNGGTGGPAAAPSGGVRGEAAAFSLQLLPSARRSCTPPLTLLSATPYQSCRHGVDTADSTPNFVESRGGSIV